MVCRFRSMILALASCLLATIQLACTAHVEFSQLSHSQLSDRDEPAEPGWQQQQLHRTDATHADAGSLHDALHNSLHRALDVVDNVDIRNLQIAETAEEYCARFNNATTGVLDCQCADFADDQLKVDCAYRRPQCNADNSTCFDGTVSQILSDQRLALSVLSCTRFTTSDTPGAETCIRVFPVNAGNFRTLDKCRVSYRPSATDSELEFCDSCTLCDFNNATNMTEISFDCCGLQTDLKQTCGPVTASGATTPRFDVIPPSEKGMCVSGVAMKQQAGVTAAITAAVVWNLL